MNLDFERKVPFLCSLFPHDIYRRYPENILDEYQNAWIVSSSMNNDNLRSCEQKLIKLDKKELEDFFAIDWHKNHGIYKNEEIYAPCVLLHLIPVLCIPGQEEKIKLVQVKLNEVLHTKTEEERYHIFERYLSQRLKAKSNLTEIDLLTGQMESEITDDDLCTGKIAPYHEFLLKLCYFEKLCNKNDDKDYKEFLRRNADLFVSQIEEVINGKNTNTKLASCKILLCLLNWNICNLKSTLIQSKIQNSEIQESCSFQSEAENTTKNTCTMYKVRCVLQNLLSTMTDNEISQVFNDYIDQMYITKSEITPDGLCIGETEPHHELQLKLCYWITICRKNDKKAYKKFIQLYPEILVSHIKKRIVLAQGIKTKQFFCKTLLCILNWNICTLKTAPLLVQKAEIQASSSVVIVADSQPNFSCTAETIRSILQTLLSTFCEEEIFTTFNNYLDILYAMKSEITEKDFCTGKIEPYYELLLKLCHCQKLCNKNNGTYREFLRRNADYFVSQIKLVVNGNKIKWKPISCTILLCLLKFNMYTLQTTPLMVQNTEIHACSADASVADTSTKYSCTAKTIWSLLKTLLSTLSEDDIFTVFKDYLDQMYTIKSEITDDDFCTGKIAPYYEFLLKLGYCEKLCIEKDEKNLKKFLRRNADFLVPQIEERVNGNKTKLISYKVLLCLSKWGISNQNTAYTSLENILCQTLTLKTHCQDFINENVPFFLSMVGTVMKRNNIPVLISLCDVLLCIPYNECHFHDVIGAVNKLIKYYTTKAGINNNILKWIIKLGYRILKHLNDNQELDTAIKIEIDFQNLFTLLEDLFTDKYYNSKTLERAINIFKPYELCYPYLGNQPCDYFLYEDFSSHYTKERFMTRLKELWIDTIKCKVKAIQISNEIRNKGREVSINKHENLIPSNISMSEQNYIDEWEADLKEEQLNTQKMEAQLNEIKMVDEMVKKLKLYEMLVLFMMSLMVIVGTSTGHHKSAKLKKYLSLKYGYATASLYLLWCSGDIEVHPGPSLNKKSLAHDSSIGRTWIQNISPKIIIRLPELLQSKYTATKKVRHDRVNREHFKSLLKTGEQEKVHVPKMYLAEINAWETTKYKLLLKLFIYRCELETIRTSLQDFLTWGGSTEDLTDINVNLKVDTEIKTNEIAMVPGRDQKPTDKSQLIAYITRHIAGISIKCAHGKDHDAKCDGLWVLPLKNWPTDIILFDPNNRWKYSESKLISDQELVDILITLPQVTIPQTYTEIVNAYKLMRKSKTELNIAELCNIFKRTTSLKKLNSALKNLSENGILTEEVHNILTKWWTTGAVETEDDKTQSLENMDDAKKKRRPHISINIGTKFITLAIEPTSKSSSKVSYNFPFNDELVPLKMMDTSASHTIAQKPSNDFHHKINAKKNLTLSPLSDANPADNQTDSITIPQETMDILNSIITYDHSYQATFESDIKLQCKTSSQDPTSSSWTYLNQTTSSTFQFSQSIKNIATSGQPVPILCTPNQSTTNSDDLGHLHISATKHSQNLDFQKQVSPTSDMGSSDSISTDNSESENEERNQNNTLNEADYSSDRSKNCVLKTNMKKRKFTEENRNEMKRRKKTSLKQDKMPEETNHRKMDSLMDNTATSNKNMELLPDCLDIDLDSFDIDDQTFDMELNALDNEGTELVKFLQDMINCEGEKMSEMKSFN